MVKKVNKRRIMALAISNWLSSSWRKYDCDPQQLVNCVDSCAVTIKLSHFPTFKLSQFHTFTNLYRDPQQSINSGGHFSQVTFILRLAVHCQIEDHLIKKNHKNLINYVFRRMTCWKLLDQEKSIKNLIKMVSTTFSISQMTAHSSMSRQGSSIVAFPSKIAW